jgi:hypothetical protein
MSLGYSSGSRRASVQVKMVRNYRSALATTKDIRLKYGLSLSKTHSPGQGHLYQPFEKGRLPLGWRTRRQHERLKERRSGHLQCTRDRSQLSNEASRGKRLSNYISGHPRDNRRFYDSLEPNVNPGILFAWLPRRKGLENIVQGYPGTTPIKAVFPSPRLLEAS